jgi:hypothetical protein
MSNQYPQFQGSYPQLYYANYPSGMYQTKVKDEELHKIVQAIENLRNPEKREEVQFTDSPRLCTNSVKSERATRTSPPSCGTPWELSLSSSRKSFRYIRIWPPHDLAVLVRIACAWF